MKASVDLTRCGGYAICVGLAPEVFDINEQGLGEVKPGTFPAEQEPAVRQAAKRCPMQAILIED